MTRLLTARCILGVLLVTLTVVLLTLSSFTIYADDPVKDRVITATISCFAGLVTVATTMFLLEVSNSISAISYGSRPTKTESVTSNFLHRFGTAKPSRKTWSNRINGFSMLGVTTEPKDGGSTNQEEK